MARCALRLRVSVWLWRGWRQRRHNFNHPSRRRVVMPALMSRDVAEIAPEIAAVDALHDADAAES